MRPALAIGLLTSLIAPMTAHADGLRCGQQLVSQGDSIQEAIDACGDPARQADLVNDYGEVIGTVMYFDPGYGKTQRRVEFRSGRVAVIERMD